jgi:hypothetical protein
MSEGMLTNFKPPLQGSRTTGRRKKIGKTKVKHNTLTLLLFGEAPFSHLLAPENYLHPLAGDWEQLWDRR